MVKEQKLEELRKSLYSKKSNTIVLDDIVYSAQGVSSGPILVVDLRFGNFDVTETKDLANVLREVNFLHLLISFN
jgi:SecD/SecF fusion protein